MKPYFESIDLHTWIKRDPLSVNFEEKKFVIESGIRELTKYHYHSSETYRAILNSIQFNVNSKHYMLHEFPPIPIKLFKEIDLLSVSKNEVKKVLTSSGTTSKTVSKIFLDANNLKIQQQMLINTVGSMLPAKRMPLLIIDSRETVAQGGSISARSAGIIGFGLFASEKVFALNNDLTLDLDSVLLFLEKNKYKPLLIFGFTYIVWKHFIKEINELKLDLDFSKGILFHGGGWKKLNETKVSNQQFRSEIKKQIKLGDVHDYYGMAEQAGSISIECRFGNLHTSIFSDVIIRDPNTLEVCSNGVQGLIQTLSLGPLSYPGHNILTEDLGVIIGDDNCRCGKPGKYFRVVGRVQYSELRGCSDVYAYND